MIFWRWKCRVHLTPLTVTQTWSRLVPVVAIFFTMWFSVSHWDYRLHWSLVVWWYGGLNHSLEYSYLKHNKNDELYWNAGHRISKQGRTCVYSFIFCIEIILQRPLKSFSAPHLLWTTKALLTLKGYFPCAKIYSLCRRGLLVWIFLSSSSFPCSIWYF